MRKTLTLLAAAAVLILPAGVHATTTATATFQVTATVVNNCTVSATDIAFGNYSSAASVAQTGTVTVTCSNPPTGNEQVSIALNSGANGSGSGNGVLRNMKNADGTSSLLPYNLYSDSNHTRVWGDDSSSNQSVTLTSSVLSQSLTVYGQIGASHAVPSGSYADTVTVTVSY